MIPGIILAEKAENGILSFNSKKRLDVGISFLKKGIVDTLILSGGVRKREGFKKIIGNSDSLAKIMKNYALKSGILGEKIILEDLSEDTVGQIIFLKYGILDPRGITSGIIITNDLHAPRVFEVAEAVLGKNHKFSFYFIESSEHERNNKLYGDDFRRTFENVDFNSKENVLERLFNHHLFYNHNPLFFKKELDKMILENKK